MAESEELSAKIAGYSSDIQDETIERYCGNIEERIQAAESKAEAVTIAEKTCRSFDQQCSSDLLKHSLQKYVAGLVEKYGKTQ